MGGIGRGVLIAKWFFQKNLRVAEVRGVSVVGTFALSCCPRRAEYWDIELE